MASTTCDECGSPRKSGVAICLVCHQCGCGHAWGHHDSNGCVICDCERVVA